MSLQSCPTLRPHRRQPTRLPHPWDSPGKNTGMGCHFLLQCMKVKKWKWSRSVCPTLTTPSRVTPLEPNKFPASWQVVQLVGEYLFHFREECRVIREHVKHCIIKCLIKRSKYSDGLELHAILEGPNKLSSSWKSDKKLSWSSAMGKSYKTVKSIYYAK